MRWANSYKRFIRFFSLRNFEFYIGLIRFPSEHNKNLIALEIKIIASRVGQGEVSG